MPNRLLLVSALALSACFPKSEEENNPPADADVADADVPGGFHDVTVNWQLKNVDGSLMSACPPGFSTLYINFYRNHYGLTAPPEAEAKLPCTTQGTTTKAVATNGRTTEEDGSHFIFEPEKDFIVVVTEETLSSEAANTPYYHVETLTSDLTLDFVLYPAGGTGALAWQFESTLTSAPLASCASAGVDTVEVAARDFFDDQAPLVVIGSWACNATDPSVYFEPNGNGFPLIDEQYEMGSGRTAGLAAGTYFTETRAKRGDAIVGTVDGQLVIEDRNDVNPITGAKIPINDR